LGATQLLIADGLERNKFNQGTSMKKPISLIVVAVICLMIGYGLYQFGLNQGIKNAATISDEIAAKNTAQKTPTEKKPLYWHDPMVPNQRFDKPGKSPFMDMELVPVYTDDGDSGGNKVSISSRVQQNLGIRTAEVILGQLKSTVTAVGNVAYNERDVALVQARSNGFVEHVYVRAPLDPVKKGQALVDLYVPDWIAAQEEYLTVRHMPGSDLDGVLQGARQRMRLAGMSEEQITKVTTSGKIQPRITITAPIGGVVTELGVREGMTVSVGAPLFRLNGLSTVWVNAEVPENLAAFVRPGNLVEASTPALSSVIFKGRVNAILPEVNTATRTIKVRIELSNPKGELVPGMFATIHFNSTPQKEKELLIPSEAVIQTGTRNVVIVMQAEGKFKPVDVETGAEANGQTEIIKGLEAGQKVVISGQFLIDSEASLKGESLRMNHPTEETTK
jgi:Cu(I)/Ag(I) efflux system membrane fusion protein